MVDASCTSRMAFLSPKLCKDHRSQGQPHNSNGHGPVSYSVNLRLQSPTGLQYLRAAEVSRHQSLFRNNDFCRSSRFMDLVALLEHVPDLREACTSGDDATLKTLRLVSKETGRVALMALKSFKLYLKGRSNDSNVSVARLLRHACLVDLTVLLTLTSEFIEASLGTLNSASVSPGRPSF